MKNKRLPGWQNTLGTVDNIISNKVLGCDDYKRHQQIEQSRQQRRQKKDQRNFWWLIMIILVGMGILIYMEYGK